MSAADDYVLRGIQSATDAALAHLDGRGPVAELLERVRELLDVDTATVLMLGPSSQQLVATATRGIESVGPSRDSRPNVEGLRRPRRGREAAGDHRTGR
jgi:hypothetical protein